MTRTMTRLTAAGTVAGTILAAALTGGTALAGTGEGGSVIPRGFLLYESQARKPVKHADEWWTISDKLGESLAPQPCDLTRAADRDRVTMRSVYYQSPWAGSGEQLVIYRSTAAARRALAGIRGHVERCARFATKSQPIVVSRARAKPVRIGDEAMQIVNWRQIYDGRTPRPGSGHSSRTVVVRKGRAVAVYNVTNMGAEAAHGAGFIPLLKDARRMAAKICSLRGVCQPAR
ncbi:hypothetical protein [Streptosporangium sp. CA-115845]|uniref:hypothetical protein n=1 Tax=Streptosporangium sp. CA-115845 TaxID=3240071 RepID=UPI003D8E9CFD